MMFETNSNYDYCDVLYDVFKEIKKLDIFNSYITGFKMMNEKNKKKFLAFLEAHKGCIENWDVYSFDEVFYNLDSVELYEDCNDFDTYIFNMLEEKNLGDIIRYVNIKELTESLKSNGYTKTSYGIFKYY